MFNDLASTKLKNPVLHKQMENIILKISNLGQDRLHFTKILREIDTSVFNDLPEYLKKQIPDNSFWKAIDPIVLGESNVSIGGVDGGIITENLTGIDLGLVNAIGVILTYNRRGVAKTKYFPNKIPTPELYITTNPFGMHDFEVLTSYKRALKEILTAIEVLDSQDYLDVLLMDGSFSLATRSNNAQIRDTLAEIISKIIEMYEIARLKGCYIAWVVKDTRQSKFVEFIGRIIPKIARKTNLLESNYRKVINCGRDQSFFSYLLPNKSRSFFLRESLNELYTQYDFPFDLFSFFLKSSPFDIPLRIDFMLNNQKNHFISSKALKMADILSSYIIPISQVHSSYSLPVPIIEADARARIDKQEFDMIIKSIQKRVNIFDVYSKKRERSPFKFK